MRAWWDRWVQACERPIDARPLALVRILVPLVVAVDLLRTAWLGLVDQLFVPVAQGGMSRGGDAWYLLDDVLGPTWGGPVAWAVTLVAMALTSLGIAVRPAIVVGVLAYAQLGHACPPADRGIDRILRTVLLILLFSGAHRRWALGNRIAGREALARIAQWPTLLLTWLLVLIYASAGVAKLMRTSDWVAWTGRPVLFRILADPVNARLDPATLDVLWPLLRLGDWATIAVELTPVLLLTRFAPYWAVFGAILHLGIAAGMNLGAFSWGMLALYPVLFAPWWLPLLDRTPGQG